MEEDPTESWASWKTISSLGPWKVVCSLGHRSWPVYWGNWRWSVHHRSWKMIKSLWGPPSERIQGGVAFSRAHCNPYTCLLSQHPSPSVLLCHMWQLPPDSSYWRRSSQCHTISDFLPPRLQATQTFLRVVSSIADGLACMVTTRKRKVTWFHGALGTITGSWVPYLHLEVEPNLNL